MQAEEREDAKAYLEDILTAARKIGRFVAGYAYDDFVFDERTFDAVLRNLEIIGEAAKKTPLAIKALAPEVEWRGMAGLRDVLIHGYATVSAAIIWDVVTVKLPALADRIDDLLRRLDGFSA